jgi:DNA polymerase-3 subunit gamma/tau
LGRLLGDLLNHFRNLLIYQVSRGDLNLLEASEAEVAALKEQSALANADALTRILEVFADAELRLRDAASKKILLEVTLLRAIEARNALPIDAVLKQLNQLRGQAGSPATAPATVPQSAMLAQQTAPVPQPGSIPPRPSPVIKIEPPPAPATPAAKPAAPPSVSTPAPGNLAELWSSLIEAVGRASSFTRSYLLNAHPVSFEKNVLVIGFDPEFEDHLSLVDNSRNHSLLQTKLAELGRQNAMIKFIKAEAPVGWQRPAATPIAPAPASTGSPQTSAASQQTQASPKSTPAAEKKPAPVPFNKEEFKNDPLIKKALEIFKGTIVEVRA